MKLPDFCRNSRFKWTMIIIGLLAAISVSNKSKADDFEGLSVTVEGKGPALIFIPGLNSDKSTFSDTCAQFKAQYTCHLLQLPGFAGLAPEHNVNEGFLLKMRDKVERYIRSKKLDKPVLVGHSLGGFMSLLIAEHAPEIPQALVIVDSLPFYSAMQNPAATEASAKPYAEMTKQQLLAQPLEQYSATSKQMAAMSMTRLAERVDRVVALNVSSDRATTAQAMYEIMTTDMRDRLATIKTPTLVLGAWAAYAPYGATKESTSALFAAQYQKLTGVNIQMSDTGYHFLSWDDPVWLCEQIKQFLANNTTVAAVQ